MKKLKNVLERVGRILLSYNNVQSAVKRIATDTSTQYAGWQYSSI